MKIMIMPDLEGVGGVLAHADWVLPTGRFYEKALCRETEALTPGVVTVAGKRGLLPDELDDLDPEAYTHAKLSAIQLAPVAIHALIRAGATTALRRLIQDPQQFRYPTWPHIP